LDKSLSASSFVVGDRLTNADFAISIFHRYSLLANTEIHEYTHLKARHDNFAQGPAFQTALQIPVACQFSKEAATSTDMQDFYKMI